MKSTREVVNRYRYAILALLVVITVAYGYYLYRFYVPAEQPAAPSVDVTVMVDGSIRLDGAQYVSTDQLKPKIAQLQKEHPGISFSIRAAYGTNFEPIGKAVVLLQHSGAKTVWVLNEKPKDNKAP